MRLSTNDRVGGLVMELCLADDAKNHPRNNEGVTSYDVARKQMISQPRAWQVCEAGVRWGLLEKIEGMFDGQYKNVYILTDAAREDFERRIEHYRKARNAVFNYRQFRQTGDESWLL